MDINLLQLDAVPILEQLRLEEALLRTTEQNWCILNTNAPKSVVMGISSKPDTVVDLKKLKSDDIPLIQRFSGGGTVLIDEGTLFATFIFQKDVHSFDPFPKAILNWAGEFYQEALSLPNFSIQGNDFTIADRKVGGNAQYIRNSSWLHHTSFLHEYNLNDMECLLHPPQEPSYRGKRQHQDFLTPLKPHLSKDVFFERIKAYLATMYTIHHTTAPTRFPDHRQATTLLDT